MKFDENADAASVRYSDPINIEIEFKWQQITVSYKDKNGVIIYQKKTSTPDSIDKMVIKDVRIPLNYIS